MPFNLDAYFDRVHWGGGATPTLANLRGLLQAHTAKIPFENLDVLLGRPVRLDAEGLQEKLVRNRRGGYCFEHATLFADALEAAGFRPNRHLARALLFGPRANSPRAHMFLTVRIEGEIFVLDPGFGTYSPRFPLALTPSEIAAPANESHRMVREGNIWTLYLKRGEELIPAWTTTLEEENRIDFVVANHWTATHPASPFVNVMILSTVVPNGRVNVMNRNLTVTRGQNSVTSEIPDRRALRSVLMEHFGFDLPAVEQLRVPAIPEW